MTTVRRKQPNISKKRKILWVCPTVLDVDLYKSSLLDILKHLGDRGNDTCLIAMRSRNLFQTKSSSVRVISAPLRYMPLVSQIMFAVMIFCFLPVYIVIFKPDFIVTVPDISIPFFPGLLISKFMKLKVILDVRSIPVETVGFQGFFQRFRFSTSIKMAKKLFDGVTIITYLMKKDICNTFDVEPDKIGVWTSGVSDRLFNPENLIAKSAKLRKKLGLTRKFVVFYHGVFTATRGLIETVKATRILKRKYSKVVFFLLGNGPIVSELKALIQSEGLQDNVIIHNQVEQLEVPKFIGMCDLCIVPLPDHPYWRSQSPLKLLEYLAMEKVVILTDIPAHRSIIGEAKCGLYISSIKPIEIAKAIEYAYINKESLEEWGKIGRKIIKEKYTWEKVAVDLENYLLSINKKVD